MAKYELNYEALDEEEQDKKKKDNSAEDMLDWLEMLITVFFAVVLVFTFIFRIAIVDGESMVPTLEDKDKLVVSHLFYEPEDGDVVIVNSKGLGKVIVKRVIATENQTVDVDYSEGKVYVDGQLLDEPYINEPTVTDFGFHDYPVTVPAGHVFVMGDNRNHSTDSRAESVGFVDKSDIMGKAVFRIWPFNKLGTLPEDAGETAEQG